jgi:hypothetical protein
MNIFKKIWEELTHDTLGEVFDRGYRLGREHEKETWEFDVRFRMFETKCMVDKKFDNKEEEYSTIPVTINFDKALPFNIGILTMTKDGKEILKPGWCLEPGFIKDKKGNVILQEVSIVKRK